MEPVSERSKRSVYGSKMSRSNRDKSSSVTAKARKTASPCSLKNWRSLYNLTSAKSNGFTPL
jgi:hypothetical protein